MKYKLEGIIAKKPNKYVYLATWISEHDGKLYFELGKRWDYFRYHAVGYEFVGKTTTVCVYPSPYGCIDHLSHEVARQTAIAYITGNIIHIDIDLADRS